MGSSGGDRRETRAGPARDLFAPVYFQRLAKTPGTVRHLLAVKLDEDRRLLGGALVLAEGDRPAMTPESKFSFFAASMTFARVGSGPASCSAFTTAIADGMP